jgi:hypothetical protein
VIALLHLSAFFWACSGEPDPIGLGEPIRVHDATLALDDFPDDEGGPAITAVEATGGVWSRGQLERSLSGRASDDAVSVALALADLGEGYWTAPVGARDPAFEGERAWFVEFDVGGGVPPGVHRLRTAAIDEAGRAGAPTAIDVCVVDPRIPGDLSPCDPSIPPPDTVFVLEWDADADVDLVVVTPEGKTVDARHPTTALEPPEMVRALDPSVGRMDGDSLAGCAPDGRNSESLFWPEAPGVAGLYLIYANLYDSCGHSSVRFALTIYGRREEEGRYSLVRRVERTGVLLARSANGGAGTPLYVTSIVLP